MTPPTDPSPTPPARLDHLVYVTPDVSASIDDLESRSGATVTLGGSHVGKGTRNAFLAIGERAYVEILGPDEDDTTFTGARRFGLDDLREPKLLTWCVEPDDLRTQARSAAEDGYDPGEVMPLSRRKPDGEVLRWTLVTHTFGDLGAAFDGVVPFMIDWEGARHPTTDLEQQITLRDFSAEHPDPRGARAALAAVGASLDVEPGAGPSLTAVFETPAGTLTLR